MAYNSNDCATIILVKLDPGVMDYGWSPGYMSLILIAETADGPMCAERLSAFSPGSSSWLGERG
jgi:hypothetical protein